VSDRPSLDWETIRRAIRELGGPRAATGQVVGQREGTEQHEKLEPYDQAQLAQIDRAAQGGLARDTLGPLAFLGIPAAAAYEGAKAIEQSLPNFATRTLLALAGGPQNEHTSPASMDNVAAYARGVAAGPEGFELDELEKYRASLIEDETARAPMPPAAVPPEMIAFLRSRGK
jgi:hypothetical protein